MLRSDDRGGPRAQRNLHQRGLRGGAGGAGRQLHIRAQGRSPGTDRDHIRVDSPARDWGFLLHAHRRFLINTRRSVALQRPNRRKSRRGRGPSRPSRRHRGRAPAPGSGASAEPRPTRCRRASTPGARPGPARLEGGSGRRKGACRRGGDLVPRTGVLRVAFGTRLAGERAVAMRPVALVSLAQDLGDLDALQDALAAKDRAEGSHERVEPMCVNRRRRFPC